MAIRILLDHGFPIDFLWLISILFSDVKEENSSLLLLLNSISFSFDSYIAFSSDGWTWGPFG